MRRKGRRGGIVLLGSIRVGSLMEKDPRSGGGIGRKRRDGGAGQDWISRSVCEGVFWANIWEASQA